MGRKGIMRSLPTPTPFPFPLCVLTQKSLLSQNMIVCLGKTSVSWISLFSNRFIWIALGRILCIKSYCLLTQCHRLRTHWKLLRMQRRLLEPTDHVKYRPRVVLAFRRKKKTQVKLRPDVSAPGGTLAEWGARIPECHDQKNEKHLIGSKVNATFCRSIKDHSEGKPS